MPFFQTGWGLSPVSTQLHALTLFFFFFLVWKGGGVRVKHWSSFRNAVLRNTLFSRWHFLIESFCFNKSSVWKGKEQNFSLFFFMEGFWPAVFQRMCYWKSLDITVLKLHYYYSMEILNPLAPESQIKAQLKWESEAFATVGFDVSKAPRCT